ncbi:glutathione S- transferase, nitrogen catabolite repression regulator [Tulasnella sp. 403]|nr:glutathione S- transferase, nitrogen catabolite repression regulator [Tulasnella sp. 403]
MATANIKLYTAPTPNGKKVSIHLEELKAVYGLSYETRAIAFSKLEQKEPWYLEINPNGRIPAITDNSRGGFNVFESAAIMLYLSQHYDLEHKFWFDPTADPNSYSELLQWIFFIHGGVGPMQGQANYFNKFASEKIPYAINRYVQETRRLYGVLEMRLKDREYLAGPGKGKFTIADMNGFPWVKGHSYSGIENFEQDFPNVKAWVERIDARPAVQEGWNVPTPPPATKEEQEKAVEAAKAWILAGNK